MTRMNDTEAVFNGLQSVFNWSQDFEMCLRNATRRDHEYAAIGRTYCAEVLAQFPDEMESIQVNFREALAHFLFKQGRIEEGLSALHEIVERWPKNVWGYIYLSDLYGHFFGNQGVPLDLGKAEEWIQRGLANVRSSERKHLIDRQKEMRKKPL